MWRMVGNFAEVTNQKSKLIMQKRVVVTGMGVVTPLGNNIETLWKNLLDGQCGIDLIKSFPTEDMPVNIAGEVKDFNPSEFGIEAPFARKQDKFTLYAVAAAKQAMDQSGLNSQEGGNIDPMRFGVYVGSGVGGLQTMCREIKKLNEEGAKWVSPLLIPTMICNMASGNIAIRHNACGPCVPIATACSTGTHSIGEAYRAIMHGYADAIITGGAEAAVTEIGCAGFANAKALSRAEDPKYASLPFNKNRGGFVMSEGAGIVILEEYEHAKNRGANILAEVVGYGNTCDANHITAPRTDGITQSAAIKNALTEAKWDADKDNIYINAHGTGTCLNDTTETKSFKMAMGDAAYKAHISSTKSQLGHMLGAAGGVEAIIAIMTLNKGIIPPTINLDETDPECDLDYTPNKPVEADINIAISDSLGFGGHNACVAFRKAE